jgi:hypothetical protein
MVEKLYEQIKKDKYKPDVIIAVARGGFYPARILCDYLRVDEMLAIDVKHYDVTKRRHGPAEILTEFDADLKGKKVLVVDDISDTGDSLKVVVEYIQKLGPGQLKTATLHARKTTNFTPDYFAEELLDDTWMTHPWTLHEELTHFSTSVLREKPKTTNEIKKELQTQYSLNIPLKKLEWTLQDMEYWKKISKTDDAKWRLIE